MGGGILSNTHKKIILAFIFGILVSGTSVYAVTKYKASDITYKNTNVENALNDLYDNMCVSGSFVGSGCSTTDGQNINLNFTPSKFFLYSHTSNVNYVAEYDKTITGEDKYYLWQNGLQKKLNYADHFKTIDNNLILYNFNNTCENNTFYYIACK